MTYLDYIALNILAWRGEEGLTLQPNSPNTDTFLHLVCQGFVAGRDGKLFLTARGLRETRKKPEPVKCA